MVSGKRTPGLSLTVFSLIVILGGCSHWATPEPISPALKPFITQASSAENTTLHETLALGIAWLEPTDGSKTLPEEERDRLLEEFRAHYSQPGMPLNVSSVDIVNTMDLSSLQQLGQAKGLSHLLVVAPTIQETVVQERFGVPRGNWLGTRTESYVYLEAVALELGTGSPIFQAQGNGEASLEALDYGAFGPFPRIYEGVYPPGYGSVYFPEGVKEEFAPGAVHTFASKKALARLLGELDLVSLSQPS